MRNWPVHTKVNEEEGDGGASLQPVEKTMVKQPMEDHSGAEIHTAAVGGPSVRVGGYAQKTSAACREPLPEQVSGRSCGTWGTHTGTVCSRRTVPCGRVPMLDQRNSMRRKEWQR